jgi:hypothetical protein
VELLAIDRRVFESTLFDIFDDGVGLEFFFDRLSFERLSQLEGGT